MRLNAFTLIYNKNKINNYNDFSNNTIQINIQFNHVTD